MFALEGYRSGELSRGQVSELLAMEFNDTERFLKEHDCGLGLSFEEYKQDSKRLREFLTR
jgi:predicted HTH domain antitoxin